MVSNEEKLTLNDILPEIIVGDIDYSLITHREANFFKIYATLRKEFSRKYPNPNPIDEDDTFIDSLAQKDEKADLFREALIHVKDVLDKIDKLKLLASDYEIACARLYCKYVFNLMHTIKDKKRQAEIKKFCSIFTDTDIFEIVESYFKIIRKYGLPMHEEPYYFLSPKRKRDIRYTGEMLKRSTYFDNNEIQVSLLEELV